MSGPSKIESYIRGRGGFKIPEYRFSEEAPTENLRNFLGFFRGIWELNIGRERWEATPVGYVSPLQDARTEHLWVPAAKNKPLVYLRYQYRPPGRAHGAPTETHTILSSPQAEPVMFSPLVQVTYLPSHNAEHSGAKDTITVKAHDESTHFTIYEADDFYYDYTARDIAEQRALAEHIAAVTDLLS